MRRSTAVLPVFVLAALLTALPAAAQPQSGTVFLSAGAVAVIDEAPDGGLTLGLTTEADGRTTMAGGALGLGVYLTPHVSVRAEVQVAGRSTTRRDLPGALAGTAPFTITQRYEVTRETTPVFALLAYHLPAGRLSVEVTGGLGLVRQSVTSRYEFSVSGPGLGTGLGGAFLPTPTVDVLTTSGTHAVAVVGADVAVAATGRLAVVPQVRAYVVGNALSVRPGIGLRWTF